MSIWAGLLEKQDRFQENELVVKLSRKFSYWKNLLLFWMMLNKASAHLYTLGNNIYTRKNSLTNIYLFIVNNIAGNSFFKSTVFLIFTKVVAAIHSLMDNVFILEEHLQPWIVYIQRTWQVFMFKLYCNFKGALAAMYLSGTVIISECHLQWSSIIKGTVFLWKKHLQSSLFSKILSLFAILVAVIQSTNNPFSIIKKQLQPHILSNLPYFFRTGGVVVRRYHSY